MVAIGANRQPCDPSVGLLLKLVLVVVSRPLIGIRRSTPLSHEFRAVAEGSMDSRFSKWKPTLLVLH